ncbi:MAG: PilZ domain-containing protein [Dysosmobacter sp.]|nr:PilZ domain-containing protein [Dysosmobacter sp.]
MGLLNLFKKKAEEEAPKEAPPVNPSEDISAYSHMRVEVTTTDGQMLFVAKLMYPQRATAELHQYSEANNSLLQNQSEMEPLPVHIRGYHDRLRKAVYMEGFITPQPKHIWLVSHLSVARVGNDRAFFRLDTDIPASVTKFSGRNAGEHPCRLLNISVGGARISSEQQYWEEDKLLLTVKLLEDRDPSIMYCKVLRVIEKEDAPCEYGCQFLELNEADQDKITENIFTAQRKSRSGAK